MNEFSYKIKMDSHNAVHLILTLTNLRNYKMRGHRASSTCEGCNS